MGAGRYTWYGTPAFDFFLIIIFLALCQTFLMVFSCSLSLSLSLSLSPLGEQVMEQLISQNFSP